MYIIVKHFIVFSYTLNHASYHASYRVARSYLVFGWRFIIPYRYVVNFWEFEFGGGVPSWRLALIITIAGWWPSTCYRWRSYFADRVKIWRYRGLKQALVYTVALLEVLSCLKSPVLRFIAIWIYRSVAWDQDSWRVGYDFQDLENDGSESSVGGGKYCRFLARFSSLKNGGFRFPFWGGGGFWQWRETP